MSRVHFLSLALLTASAASAQTTTTPPFSIKLNQGTSITTITDGGTISFAADAVGRPADVIVNTTFTGVITPPSTIGAGTVVISFAIFHTLV